MKQAQRIFAICLAALLLATAAAAAAPLLLKQGMTGDEVTKLQVKLQEYGYLQAEPDGNFGGQTRRAILEFQLDAGLEADGIAGPATLKALEDYKPSVSRGSLESRMGQQIVAFARQFIGVPYVWAGRSSDGFDCSGFVWYVYDNFGIHLPRMADGQFEVGLQVGRRDLAPGDLVFFSTYEPGPSHVGIYAGSGLFIHASSGADAVTVTPINKAYYLERYLGARRLIR